ncbi:hypothetical protein B484DRAFT_331083 [Ochromonadaceae sp. CCMP2298]|nr:hypothetical protein B484DRAFT_331083 [Ochromonadaceae sp. CCMP2298]
MGKPGKKADVVKLEAKKEKRSLKQEKTTSKRNKKENAGEEDIDAIIAEFSAKESARTAVTVEVCSQPSARSNFSLTLLPTGELLMFGGEYCDGASTEMFNDVHRWNPEKSEWRHVESLNTPPPRCSHQAVCYKDKLYIFGGEYATLDQFHHYRDLWELDLKSNVWTEVAVTGDAPSARSGHRMLVWRGYLLLFGGFYEAMREVRWYSDCYVFSFQVRGL